jgi:O-antigen/teichoic acid export membrane protein
MKINKTLISGSLILLISFNLYNAMNFFYHFFMARMLTIVQYGVLASLFSIIYMLALFTESIQIVITKYSNKESNKGKLKNLLKKFLKKASRVSLSLFILYLIIAVPLSYLLDIRYYLLALNGLMVFVSFFSPITRGILQGRKRFSSLGKNMITEAVIKLALAILFVYLGWQVFGAISGAIIGPVVAIALSFVSISDIIKSKEKPTKLPGIYGYAKPAFVINIVLLIAYTVDVLIAKIVFSPEIAGAYAIAATLAKIVFFGTQPISRAMFPLSAEQKTKKKSENVLGNALSLLGLAILVSLIIFFFFPDLIISIFSGKDIPQAVSVLFFLGLAMSILSITNLVLLYKLSIGATKGYQYLLGFLVLELILLFYFSSSIIQFSIAFITSAVAILWASIFLLSE